MRELKVQPIRNGTVIDHIAPGTALKVLRILKLPKPETRSSITAALNVPSKKGGKKDIVKVEDRELDPREVDKIALIAPKATINIIREYNVAEKHNVRIPQNVTGIVRCGNPNCITNQQEPVAPQFSVAATDPPRLRCHYCDRELQDVAEHIV